MYRTVSNQRRLLPRRNAQQTTQPMILTKHRVSNHRMLQAFVSPEAPVRSVLTVLPLLLRRCIWGTYSPAAGMLPGPVLPAAGAVSTAGPPSGRSVDDISNLVVPWVNQFNGRLYRLSEKIAHGLDQLELAFAALVRCRITSPQCSRRTKKVTNQMMILSVLGIITVNIDQCHNSKKETPSPSL